MPNSEIGKINSIQTLGTVDGPGVRFVVFMQGCNLRCGCCHNPDTWDMNAPLEYTPEDLVKKVVRYKEYFGNEGGITVSGGEPLLQSDFVRELFIECKNEGINTCLDTSGSILNDSIKNMLEVTDMVLLDIKYTNDEDYKNYVGCSIDAPLEFLEELKVRNIPTIIRQVIIPTINDDEENIKELSKITKKYPNVIKTELLGFKKLCQVKYDKLNLEFPFGNIEATKSDDLNRLRELLNKNLEIV